MEHEEYVTVCRADCLQFLYKKLSHLASDRKEPYPSSPGYLLHARAATVLQSHLPASLSCGRTPAVYFCHRRNLVVAPRLIELIGVGLLVIAVLQLHQSCQGIMFPSCAKRKVAEFLPEAIASSAAAMMFSSVGLAFATISPLVMGEGPSHT